MAIVDGHIRCNQCKEARPLAAFPASVVARGNGRCSRCSTLSSAARRADPVARMRDNAKWRNWYRNNREKHLARTHRVYHRDPSRAAGRHLERAYGISIADYERMLAAQGGGCAICRKPPRSEGMRFAVDHDHDTGRIRGLLCHPCNGGLGVFGDSIDGLRRALNYLERAQQPAPCASPAIRINLLKGAN